MKHFLTRIRIIVSAKDKNKAINLIVNKNLSCLECNVKENRDLEIIFNARQLNKFKTLFKQYDVDARFEKIPGLISYVESIKHRWGIWIGVILATIVLVLSSNFVWKIDIAGNNIATDEEILKELENAGLTLGSYIPKIDYDIIHNRVLMNSEKLSWISVNIKGTVATVKVKEKQTNVENIGKSYTNVVAKYDGYISSVLVKEGERVVSIGDVVKKGDILISGVIDSQSQGVRYEHAQGEVKAYVNKEINIKLPFKTVVKKYTGKVKKKKSHKIYNFPLNFLNKYSNSDAFYDTIEKKEKLSVFGITDLPIEITTTTYYEYFLEEVSYTKAEITDLAFIELRRQIDIQLKNAELVSKKVSMRYDSECFYLDCELYCLEDIACEKEFFLTN